MIWFDDDDVDDFRRSTKEWNEMKTNDRKGRTAQHTLAD